MATTLTVIHRGASLWVNRTTAGYWEVLMPDVTLEHGADGKTPLQRHHPKLVADSVYNDGKGDLTRKLTDRWVDLRGLNPAGSTKKFEFDFILPLAAEANAPVRLSDPFNSSRVTSFVRLDPTDSFKHHDKLLGKFRFGNGRNLDLAWAVEWTVDLAADTLSIPVYFRNGDKDTPVVLNAHNNKIVIEIRHLSVEDEALPLPTQYSTLFDPDFDFAGLYALTCDDAGVPPRDVPYPEDGYALPTTSSRALASEVEEVVDIVAEFTSAMAARFMDNSLDAKAVGDIAERATAMARRRFVDPTHLCSNGYVEPPI